MSENNISIPQTMTEQSSTLSAVDPVTRTKQKKWWMSELFEMREHEDQVSGELHSYLTCKGCSWFTRAKIPNTTKLGHHLLRCNKFPPDTRNRLLQEKKLQKYYRNNFKTGGSELFGFPVTPSISKKRKSFVSSSKPTERQGSSSNPLGTDNGHAAVLALTTEQEESETARQGRTQFNELLTRFFVKHMLPFSLLSRKEGADEFYQLIKIANPSLAAQLPDSQRMSTKNLSRYFASVAHRVRESISATLTESFGTLMFDGWTDSNRQSVVNILLSVTGAERVRKTFFLKSVYTGSNTCDAAYYAKLVDECMLEFGDMKRICAVVSDNTSSCVKAKETLLQKHDHMISVQDQTHLANLLMEDIGKLYWVKQILSMVSSVIGDLRNHSKLYHRFKELKTQFNLQGSTSRTCPGLDQYGRVKLPPTAILPCPMAATRFASSESMTASFLRSKSVLLDLIACPDFSSNLYNDRNSEKRELFKGTIRDESLYDKLLDIYHILRLVRQYLRIFDDESSLISEVYPATMQLFSKVKQLPLTPFYTAQRRSDVIRVFEERLHGEGRKKALVTPLHRVAYILDLRSLRENIASFRPHLVNHVLSFARSACFPPSEKFASEGGENAAVERICQEFVALRSSWRSNMQDPVSRLALTMYNRSPVNYWIDYDNSSLLRQFALRVLCSSPSSSSVERSFSLQARIRTSTRNRLHQDKVSKLIFCAFNESLSRSRDRTVRKLSKKDYATLRFGATADAMPSSSVTGESSGQPYSRFLDDEYTKSGALEEGEDDMDLEDLAVMQLDFAACHEENEVLPENESDSIIAELT